MKRICRQTTIYVGLNDSVTREQKFETPKYISILTKVCVNYNVAFSLDLIDGGYIHEDGTYVEEKTIALMMIDVPKETVEEIARDLCAFFRQESVMVAEAPAKVFFVQEKLLDETR